jgi:hypothetical protein
MGHADRNILFFLLFAAPFSGSCHGSSSLFLFPADYGPAGALPGAGVSMGPLASGGQGPAMPQTAIAAEVHKPFNVHGNFAAQVAFDLVFVVKNTPDARHLFFSQIIRLDSPLYFRLSEDALGTAATKSVDIGQGDFDPFVLW